MARPWHVPLEARQRRNGINKFPSVIVFLSVDSESLFVLLQVTASQKCSFLLYPSPFCAHMLYNETKPSEAWNSCFGSRALCPPLGIDAQIRQEALTWVLEHPHASPWGRSRDLFSSIDSQFLMPMREPLGQWVAKGEKWHHNYCMAFAS